MEGSEAELFSEVEDLPLQISCSSSSDSEPEERSFFRNLDMCDLFKDRSSTPKTSKQLAFQGSRSASRATSNTKSTSRNAKSASVTPSGNLNRRRTVLPYSRPTIENENDEPTSENVSEGSNVTTALKEMTNILNNLVKRVEGTEKELKLLKNYASTTGSGSSSNSSTSRLMAKHTVPLIVRAETRKLYQTLVEDGENFNGFNIEPPSTFKDPENQGVVQKLIQEIHSLNPSFQSHDIRSAAYTYYKTLRQEASMNRRGVSEARKKHRRRRERIFRKLQERQSVFAKRSYHGSDKEKWQKVLTTDMMSSEESEDDKIIVKPLIWWSNKVKRFFDALDEQLYAGKSSQAKRQMKERVIGEASVRSKPASGTPSWTFEKNS